MRLNPDCIRDLLLVVEDKCTFDRLFNYPSDCSGTLLEKYSPDEVLYHARQCDYSGLIIGYSVTLDGHLCIFDLDPAGHEFLSNIRSESHWTVIKDKAAKVGSMSLDTIINISVRYIASLITNV